VQDNGQNLSAVQKCFVNCSRRSAKVTSPGEEHASSYLTSPGMHRRACFCSRSISSDCPEVSDECHTQWRRFLLNTGGRHCERGARAYTGGLAAEPPAWSRGRALGHGVRKAKPPEAEIKLNFDTTITRLIVH